MNRQGLYFALPPQIPGLKIDLISKEEGYYSFFRPTSHIVDIAFCESDSIDVKIELARFGNPPRQSVQFEKGHGWEHSLFTPQEIVDGVKEALGRDISLVYTRIDLMKGEVVSTKKSSGVHVEIDKSTCKNYEQKNSVIFLADLNQISSVRHFVRESVLRASGQDEVFSRMLELAIDEAFCNIVRHGSQRQSGVVKINSTWDSEGISFEIHDQGKIFDPETISDPDFSGERIGGFGLFLIKEIADKLSYTSKKTKNGWNRLLIIKKFRKKGDEMDLSHKMHENVLVITLEGESLDAKRAAAFKQQVKGIIDENNCQNLIFNLEKLGFIDSTGLGSFLSILRAANEEGGDLKLASMSRPIKTIFELVSMHKVFEIFNSVDDALRAFQVAS